jgi:hypothetical protein
MLAGGGFRAGDESGTPDAALPVWAGVLPLTAAWQTPDPDPMLPANIPLPARIAALVGWPAGVCSSARAC